MSWGEEFIELGDADMLDTYTKGQFANLENRVKKFIDGTIRAFFIIDTPKGFDIVDSVVEFDDVFMRFINSLK